MNAPSPTPVPARFFGAGLKAADPEVFAAISHELKRQQDQIELIES